MEKSKKILKVENLKKAYYSTSRTGESITYPVLNNVSFEIEEGEFVGIMGRSGCGKTTLLKAVGMLDKPDDGTIYYQSLLHNGEETKYPAKVPDVNSM